MLNSLLHKELIIILPLRAPRALREEICKKRFSYRLLRHRVTRREEDGFEFGKTPDFRFCGNTGFLYRLIWR